MPKLRKVDYVDVVSKFNAPDAMHKNLHRVKLKSCLSMVVNKRKAMESSRATEIVKLTIFRLLTRLKKGGTTARKNVMGYLQFI